MTEPFPIPASGRQTDGRASSDSSDRIGVGDLSSVRNTPVPVDKLEIEALRRTNLELQAQLEEQRLSGDLAEMQLRVSRMSFDRLVSRADLSEFPGEVLVCIVQQLGADEGAIWLHDPIEQTMTLETIYQDGKLSPGSESSHPGKKPHPNQKDTAFNVQAVQRQPFVMDDEFIDTDPHMEKYRSYLASRKIRTILAVPMFFQDSFLGSFTVSHTRKKTYTDGELGLAKTLANQAVMALHVRALSTAQSSLAVEQELSKEREEAANRRADIIARAGAAVKDSLGKLAARGSVDAFLESTMASLVSETRAVGAGLWLWASDQVSRQVMMLEDGVLFVGPGMRDRGYAVGAADGSHASLRRGEIHYQRSTILTNLPWYSEFRERLEAQRIVALASVPLFVGEENFGAVVLRFREDPFLSADEESLALALGNHIALALEFNKLAEASKALALAEEREQASRAQVEKLAKANDLLRHSAERLSRVEDIDLFLGQVLLSITEVLGSESATVWANDYLLNHSVLKYVVESGQLIPAKESNHPNAHSPYSMPNNAGHIMSGHGTSAAKPIQSLIEAQDGLNSEHRTYFASHGYRWLVSVPMVLGGKHLGTFTIRLKEDSQLLAEQSQLIEALANQAAVALQLTQLADQARQAAIAHEREQASYRRALELSKANEAIAAGVSALAENHDLDDFLQNMLQSVTKQFGSHSSTLWLLDRNDRFRIRHAFTYNGSPTDQSATLVKETSEFIDNHDHPGHLQILQGQPVFMEVDTYEWIPDSARQSLLDCGFRTIVSMPVMLGDRVLGAYVTRFTDKRVYDSDEIELAKNLGSQLALALELSYLADEAKASAIAEERRIAADGRALELARANEAMRRTVDAMTSLPALDELLAQVMRSINEHLQSPASTLWRITSEFSELQLVCVDGVVYRDPPERDGFKPMTHIALHPEHLSKREDILAGRYVFIPNAYESSDLDSNTREWMKRTGGGGLLVIPIRVGTKVIGCMCIHQPTGTAFPDTQVELAVALVQQAALAINVSDLADEAQRAAIERAQQKSMRERLDVLARANDALRGTIEKLAGESSYDNFLGHALDVLIEHFGGIGGAFWRYVPDEHSTYLVVERHGPRTIYAGDSNHPSKVSRRADLSPSQQMIDDSLTAGEIVVMDVSNNEVIGESEKSRLLAARILTLVVVPIMAGDVHLGRFSIRLSDRRSLEATEIELARTLASQAALALEMSRLAEESKQAAVFREKETAAKSRADDLASTNEAIRNSLAKLTSMAAIDEFLGHVLRHITTQLGSRSAILWLRSSDNLRFILHLCCFEGELRRSPPDTPDGIKYPQEGPYPTDPDIVGRYNSQTPWFIDDIISYLNSEEDRRAWLKHFKVKGLLIVPLVIAGQTIGLITVQSQTNGSFPQSKVELVSALAQQSALALHVARMAEQANAAAILRQQEIATRENLAELSAANLALRESAAMLVDIGTLDGYLDTVLNAALQVSCGNSGAVVLANFPSHSLSLASLVHRQGRNVAGDSKQRGLIIHDDATAWKLIQGSLMAWVDVAELDQRNQICELLFLSEDAKVLLLRMETRDQVVGFLAIGFEKTEMPGATKLEVLNTLAQQATLAVSMSRLAQKGELAAYESARLIERNRIARDLHDTLAQGFTGVLAQIGGAKAAGRRGEDAVSEACIQRAEDLARSSLVEARRAVHALEYMPDRSIPASVRIETMLAQTTLGTNVRAHCQSEGTEVRDERVNDALFRISQEAVTNALKYSGADTLLIKLSWAENTVTLLIHDNGTGFDLKASTDGMGLRGMKSRAESVQGIVKIVTAVGAGTTVEAQIPTRG